MSHPMETGNRFRTLDEPTRHLPFQMSENMFCTHGRLNMKNGKPPLFHLFHDFALRQGALHIRKLPQAGKHSLRRTSAKRNPVAAPQQKNSPPFLTPRFLLRSPRFRFADVLRRECLPGKAPQADIPRISVRRSADRPSRRVPSGSA